jgi:hypothetical protein
MTTVIMMIARRRQPTKNPCFADRSERYGETTSLPVISGWIVQRKL